jgi:hypothetical protein
MSKHTLEQVLEALINKEEDRASELLHQFFVAKGKSIYEELSQFDEAAEEDSEEDLEEGIGGAAGADFEDEIIEDEMDLEDEQLFGEAEGDEEEDPMSAEEPSEDEATADLAMGGEEGADDAAGADGEAEQALQKVDDALADLKAIFADLMGGEGSEEPADADVSADDAADDEFAAMGESVSLKAVAKPTHGDDGQNTKSPVSNGAKISANGAKAVKFTGEAGAGMATPSSKTDDMGNVNKVGNAKAPAQKSVSVPKNSDGASNKTSPVAKA